ncbi:hypothetical protein K432DRAFT_401011 [Lepidopterella palustris CBS 459.81]|uniref:TFG box profile domain-containing protein n=1 Tax=Lepidopterella palustris CBS 459.81 TaxID=1314670 RepID=A0A8E2EIQ7_9PEZI|nr:hypothetical protein K432DRAFT_401011 [Lepidopterella palustris CBS 459.81]
MSEFIGSRISLISKSDIRYVGTLHEINSENSTVALENVTSFGTEGRRNGDDEIPASDNIYEYIVFRGSDVKDLRIEEPARESKPAPPPMPNDPAILGATRATQPPGPPPGPPPQNQQQRPQPQNFSQPGQYPPAYPPYGPPFQNQRLGPQGGFLGGPGGPGGYPGYPGMPGPYGGGPPAWYPPPGQGFPHPPGPGLFSPQPPMPIGPPGQHNQQQQQHQHPQPSKGAPTAPIGPPVNREEKPNAQPKVAEADGATKPVESKSIVTPTSQTTPPAALAAKQPPPPPVESKPDVTTALAAPTQTLAPLTQPASAPKAVPTGPKSGRIVPAVPLHSPGATKAAITSTVPAQTTPGAAAQPGQATANAALQYQNTTQAATAAVAAAMAKLGPAPGQKPPTTQARQHSDTAMDNLTKKVNEMRTDEHIRHGRQPGTGGYAAGYRGTGRGRGGRGGHANAGQPAPKIDVPTTDFDFQLANAKFNKHDLVKEAIASGATLGGDVAALPPTEAPTNGHAVNGNPDASNPAAAEQSEVVIPAAVSYDKKASFFDNISSELKDREEAVGRKLGGQEFRSEERKKNLETFGQGSVDGYRGGYRGRGRGRGFGRGRGGGFRGRGAVGNGAPPRGRGGAQGVEG